MLSFNIFGNVLHRKQTWGGSGAPTSSMMEVENGNVKMEIISYWQSSSNLDDGGIVELPL